MQCRKIRATLAEKQIRVYLNGAEDFSDIPMKKRAWNNMAKEQELQALLDDVVRRGEFMGVSALYLQTANRWPMRRRAWQTGNAVFRLRGIPFAGRFP